MIEGMDCVGGHVLYCGQMVTAYIDLFYEFEEWVEKNCIQEL